MEENKSKGRGRPKGSFKVKMNKSEKERFINISLKRILGEHLSWKEYTSWCRETYDISGKQANDNWLEVWGIIRQKYKLERENLVNKHLHKYWELYDKALNNDDINTARQILNDISKIQGLNEPDKLVIDTDKKIILKFGDEDGGTAN